MASIYGYYPIAPAPFYPPLFSGILSGTLLDLLLVSLILRELMESNRKLHAVYDMI